MPVNLENRPPQGPRATATFERLLLGDRARLFLAPALIVTLAFLLNAYGAMVAESHPSLDTFRRNPLEFVGRPFTVSFATVAEVSERGFRLRQDDGAIDVIMSGVEVSVDSIVSVRGRVRPDLRLQGGELRVHRGRRIKWLLGALVLSASLIVVVRERKAVA